MFPRDQEQGKLTIKPPKICSARTGSYNVIIKVTSAKDSTIETSAQLAVEVGRLLLSDLDLSPKKARGRSGSYKVSIHNTGNVPTTYKLSGDDPEELCRFDFKHETVVIEPCDTAEVPLVVNPRNRLLIEKAKDHGFKTKVTPHE